MSDWPREEQRQRNRDLSQWVDANDLMASPRWRYPRIPRPMLSLLSMPSPFWYVRLWRRVKRWFR